MQVFFSFIKLFIKIYFFFLALIIYWSSNVRQTWISKLNSCDIRYKIFSHFTQYKTLINIFNNIILSLMFMILTILYIVQYFSKYIFFSFFSFFLNFFDIRVRTKIQISFWHIRTCIISSNFLFLKIYINMKTKSHFFLSMSFSNICYESRQSHSYPWTKMKTSNTTISLVGQIKFLLWKI